jgi:tRNA threonylcarbamoyladenosine biosynthesis protein TsaE
MPILTPDVLEFISRSPEQTQRIGARLGARFLGGEIIALEGELGAGKTVLAQGIGTGWGAREHLISPTFVLMREYTRPPDAARLYHIDLYRLASPIEVAGLGLDDVLGDTETACIIEWPDRAPALFEDEVLWITLHELDEFRRSLLFRASGPHHTGLLEQLRQALVGGGR